MSVKSKVIKTDNSKKIWIIVGIVIIGLLILIEVVNTNSHKSNVLNATPLPNSVVKTSPSERALKAAAWIYTNSSKTEMDAIIKKNPSLGGNTPAEIVNNVAKFLDQNPANLAMVEADMQKAGNQGAQQNIQYSYPETTKVTVPTVSNSDSDYKLQQIQNCQRDTQTYNECVQTYNDKMADYSQCLAEASDPTSIRAQGFGRYASMSCYKPFNSCMKPISCY